MVAGNAAPALPDQVMSHGISRQINHDTGSHELRPRLSKMPSRGDLRFIEPWKPCFSKFFGPEPVLPFFEEWGRAPCSASGLFLFRYFVRHEPCLVSLLLESRSIADRSILPIEDQVKMKPLVIDNGLNTGLAARLGSEVGHRLLLIVAERISRKPQKSAPVSASKASSASMTHSHSCWKVKPRHVIVPDLYLGGYEKVARQLELPCGVRER